jgi:hypothetical protein
VLGEANFEAVSCGSTTTLKPCNDPVQEHKDLYRPCDLIDSVFGQREEFLWRIRRAYSLSNLVFTRKDPDGVADPRLTRGQLASDQPARDWSNHGIECYRELVCAAKS